MPPLDSPASRDTPAAPAHPVRFGPYVFDAAQARLHTTEGHTLELAGRPFELLGVLLAQPGRLIDKSRLLDAVWGHRHVSESVLKGAVNTLRLALGDDARAPRYIETVPRRGYRFVAAVQTWPGEPTVPARTTSAGPARPAPEDSLGPAPGNMPRQVERPIGREAESALLQGLLAEHRLVTLTGLGGVGKTCLALAMAARAAEPAGGRWLLRLDELADPGLLLPTLAQCLHLGRPAAASAAALAEALADQQLLLVLDNAEHLVDAVAELAAALLAQAPEVQLLVTSQVPLRLAAEALLPLAPLALPPEPDGRPLPLDDYPAACLLVQRIRQQRAGWQPDTAEQQDIAALCRLLDGMPLALELAAARVPLLGLAGVRARLDQRFLLLASPSRDVPARHRTLGAALSWTFGLLDEAERGALWQLAVFAGSFSLTDAEGVLAGSLGDAALDAVEELRARALLVADHGTAGGPRLRLYDSVRRHALQALAEAGQDITLRLVHLQWMRQRLADLWQTDLFEATEHWLPGLRADADNVREALRFGLSATAPAAATEPAVQLAADSARLWHRLGHFSEGWRWLLAAAERLQALGDPAPPALQGRLDLATAFFCGGTQQGDPRQALARLPAAWAWVDSQPDAQWVQMAAVAEYDLVLRLHPDQVDRLDALVARLQAGLAPHWPPMARRHWLRALGSVRRLHGDFQGMRQAMDDYEALCRAEGAHEAALVAVYLRLQALALLGAWDEARQGANALAAELRRLGLVRESVFHLATAAAVLLRLGPRPGDELATVHEALRLLAGSRLLWWLADALPWAAWHAGRAADAARLQAWADHLADARGEARGPLFGGMRQSLQAALAAAGVVATTPPPADEASALDLALGPGTAAALLPAPVRRAQGDRPAQA